MQEALSQLPNLAGDWGTNAPTGMHAGRVSARWVSEINCLGSFPLNPFLFGQKPARNGIGRNTDRTKNDLSVLPN
jgi:hypothetical protein